MKERCVKFFRYFFPIFFLIYLGDITLFTHSHIINGVTIVHSHPFKKDNTGHPVHQHTPAQFQLIHQLSSFGSEDISTAYTSQAIFLVVLAVLVIGLANPDVGNIGKRIISLRAPPFISVLYRG